jgi:hypothetical protein
MSTTCYACDEVSENYGKKESVGLCYKCKLAMELHSRKIEYYQAHEIYDILKKMSHKKYDKIELSFYEIIDFAAYLMVIGEKSMEELKWKIEEYKKLFGKITERRLNCTFLNIQYDNPDDGLHTENQKYDAVKKNERTEEVIERLKIIDKIIEKHNMYKKCQKALEKKIEKQKENEMMAKAQIAMAIHCVKNKRGNK